MELLPNSCNASCVASVQGSQPVYRRLVTSVATSLIDGLVTSYGDA